MAVLQTNSNEKSWLDLKESMTGRAEEEVDSRGLLMTGWMEDVKEKGSLLLWSIQLHCLLLTLVGLRWIYSRLSFMRLGFFPDRCWSHGNKWVHQGNKWVLKMRKERDLEWDARGYYAKDEVSKDIHFLSHFFSPWNAAAFGRLHVESSFLWGSLIIKPGNLFYSTLLNHVRLQNY